MPSALTPQAHHQNQQAQQAQQQQQQQQQMQQQLQFQQVYMQHGNRQLPQSPFSSTLPPNAYQINDDRPKMVSSMRTAGSGMVPQGATTYDYDESVPKRADVSSTLDVRQGLYHTLQLQYDPMWLSAGGFLVVHGEQVGVWGDLSKTQGIVWNCTLAAQQKLSALLLCVEDEEGKRVANMCTACMMAQGRDVVPLLQVRRQNADTGMQDHFPFTDRGTLDLRFKIQCNTRHLKREKRVNSERIRVSSTLLIDGIVVARGKSEPFRVLGRAAKGKAVVPLPLLPVFKAEFRFREAMRTQQHLKDLRTGVQVVAPPEADRATIIQSLETILARLKDLEK